MLTPQGIGLCCDKGISPAHCPAQLWPKTSQMCLTLSLFWGPLICTSWSRSKTCYRNLSAQVSHVLCLHHYSATLVKLRTFYHYTAQGTKLKASQM